MAPQNDRESLPSFREVRASCSEIKEDLPLYLRGVGVAGEASAFAATGLAKAIHYSKRTIEDGKTLIGSVSRIIADR